MSNLSDNFGRNFSYLRLSVTDVCNFRCGYCLPNGYQRKDRSFLSISEIHRLVTAFSELGVRKIRLTGGEPTTRKDFTEIAAAVSSISGINKLAFTSNGYQLKKRAQEYFDAGLTYVNVSVDSLQAEKFKQITGHDRLDSILEGIDEAPRVGFESVKINVVLLKGINDDEVNDFLRYIRDKPVSVRYIELMQTGDNQAYFNKHHLSADIIRQKLIMEGWNQQVRSIDAGPAIEFSHPDYQGRIGLIAPYSPEFCQTCNRLRISSRGALHLCLFAALGYDLRRWLQADEQKDELKQRIQNLLQHKEQSHFLHQGGTGSTEQLAQIGG